MIGRLEGRILEVDPGRVIVDVGGVGYLVSTTLRTVQQLAGAATGALLVHTQVKDDAIELYGFPSPGELEAFQRLIGIAGVGPRIALAVLSSLPPEELAAVVSSGDVARLTMTPGVGKKTAQRILLELKGKLTTAAVAGGDLRGDAASALVNLGYRQSAAVKAVEAVLADNPADDVGEILRLALQRLTR
ncbi:MAG: Holliday junction branch migration protein RuvA [Thermoanaerobaculales bacterium]|jgi:Holliday junction DNA helicase RuvA|nr:Holliday junction branch migration protein RuvA [Thermoanaerobaculales bacterium]